MNHLWSVVSFNIGLYIIYIIHQSSVCVCMYICMCVYEERERERERVHLRRIKRRITWKGALTTPTFIHIDVKSSRPIGIRRVCSTYIYARLISLEISHVRAVYNAIIERKISVNVSWPNYCSSLHFSFHPPSSTVTSRNWWKPMTG